MGRPCSQVSAQACMLKTLTRTNSDTREARVRNSASRLDQRPSTGMGSGTVAQPRGEDARLHEWQHDWRITRRTYSRPRQSRQSTMGLGHPGDLARGVLVSAGYREALRRPPDMEILGLPM